jgi:RHS repeat-associated protein
VSRSKSVWSVYQDPSKWYIFQVRKISDTNLVDGITTATSYSYNNSNGQVSLSTEDLDLKSDLSGLRDRVTKVSFAFEQSINVQMKNSNMLSQVYETTDSAVGPGLTSVLLSRARSEYDSTTKYGVRSLQWNGSSWDTTNTIVSRDSIGNITESYDIDKVHGSTRYGFNSVVPVISAVNASYANLYASNFSDSSLAGWTITDNYVQGNTKWNIENRMLKQIDSASAQNSEHDHILYDLGSEITGDAVIEFDVRFDYCNTWDLTFAAGGDAWDGVHSYNNNEEAIWTAMNNDSWYYEDNVNGKIAKSGLVVGQTYHLKIVVRCTAGTADYYVDGLRVIANSTLRKTTTGIRKFEFGNHGNSTVTSTWYIDNIRAYPASAFVTSSNYDPYTLQVTSKGDANGLSTYYGYDGFSRPTQVFNDDKKVISEQSSYCSRDGHSGTFSASDPNFSTKVTYTSPTGYGDFTSPTGWTYSGDVTFDIEKTAETTVRVGYTPQNCYPCGGFAPQGTQSESSSDTVSNMILLTDSLTGRVDTLHIPLGANVESGQPEGTDQQMVIESGGTTCCDSAVNGTLRKNAGTGNIIARVDFYADGGAGGVPRIEFTSGSYHFGVYWYSGTTFKAIAGGSIVYTFRQPGNRFTWYTIELEKTSTGTCYAWVYPKGGARDYSDMWSQSYYPGDWNADFYSENNGGDYFFLANCYIGSFSQATSYADGFGRTLQTQTRDELNDLVSPVQYDSLGRQFRAWRTYSYNTSHKYDSLYATHDTSVFHISNPYTEKLYKTDPLSRDSVLRQVGWAATNEDFRNDYNSATLSDGILYQYAETKQKPSTLSANPWMISRQFRDKLGRIVQSTTYASGVAGDTLTSKSRFNFLNEPVATYAPKGDSTNLSYDFLGRLAKKVNADQGTSKYVYDKAGRLRFMIDSVGLVSNPNKVLYWKYDKMRRVSEKGWISRTWSTISQSTADSTTYPTTPLTWRKKYLYDSSNTCNNLVGRLSSILTNNDDDSVAEVEEYFTYDKFGNVDSVKQKVIDFNTTVYATRYKYDLLGRTLEVIYPNTTTVDVTYNYDQVGRVTTVGSQGGSAFATYKFRSDGEIDSEKVNLGGTMKARKFIYDARGRLTSIASDLFREGITYDNGGYNSNEGFYHGLIASDTITYPFGGGPSQLIYRFQYDNFGRLTIADNSYDSLDIGTGTNNATTYDYNSNVTHMRRAARPLQTYAYYSATNRIQNIDGSGNDYVYDQTGNSTVSPKLTSLMYDPFTTLTMKEKKTSSDSLLFQYGGSKQRVYKAATVGGATTKTIYLHGGANYPLMEKIGTKELAYIYGPTGLIAYRDSLTWYYLMRDHLNSTRVVFNTSGTAQTTYDFDSYGALRRSTVSPDIRYRFTGQEYDNETSLNNFRARMYDVDLGTFYATDPAGQTFSPYSYAGDNPISNVDPTGTVYDDYVDPQDRINWTQEYNRNINMQSYYNYAVPITTKQHYECWARQNDIPFDENSWLDTGGHAKVDSRHERLVRNFVKTGEATIHVLSDLPGGGLVSGYNVNYDFVVPVGHWEERMVSDEESVLKDLKDAAGLSGLTAEAIEGYTGASGAARITYYSPNGVKRWVSSEQVIEDANFASKGFFVTTTLINGTMWLQNKQSGSKTLLNIGVEGLATALPPEAGVILGAGYLLLDASGAIDAMLSTHYGYRSPFGVSDATSVKVARPKSNRN